MVRFTQVYCLQAEPEPVELLIVLHFKGRLVIQQQIIDKSENSNIDIHSTYKGLIKVLKYIK